VVAAAVHVFFVAAAAGMIRPSGSVERLLFLLLFLVRVGGLVVSGRLDVPSGCGGFLFVVKTHGRMVNVRAVIELLVIVIVVMVVVVVVVATTPVAPIAVVRVVPL